MKGNPLQREMPYNGESLIKEHIWQKGNPLPRNKKEMPYRGKSFITETSL